MKRAMLFAVCALLGFAAEARTTVKYAIASLAVSGKTLVRIEHLQGAQLLEVSPESLGVEFKNVTIGGEPYSENVLLMVGNVHLGMEK